jgi:prophage tail gpP-like protein
MAHQQVNQSTVTLSVNGKDYAGWESVNISRSLDAIAGRFELATTDVWKENNKPWDIVPGDKCQISIDGTAVINGYVDSATPAYSAQGHGITISGRDKAGDLVDCSAVVKSYEIQNKTLKQIIDMLVSPFGITCSVDSGVDVGSAFRTFAIQPGETVWMAIQRAARQKFMLVTASGDGNIKISDIATQTADVDLKEGDNILTASGEYNFQNRFSIYLINAQLTSNDGETPGMINVTGRATDSGINRYRPKILSSEIMDQTQTAGQRAKLEAQTRAANSTRVNVSVAGWKQTPTGKLWGVNLLTRLTSPMLSLDEDLLINAVTFALSDGDGFTTSLGLVRPEAYLLGQGKGRRGKKEKKQTGGSASGYDPWYGS